MQQRAKDCLIVSSSDFSVNSQLRGQDVCSLAVTGSVAAILYGVR